MHPAQDGLLHGLEGVAAGLRVPVDLLYPLQVGDWNDADQQVGVAADVDLLGDDRPVQAFVKQAVGIRGNVFPGCEAADLQATAGGFFRVVKVMAAPATPRFAIGAEEVFELFEEVGFRPEVTDSTEALVLRIDDEFADLAAGVAVKTVALDDGGVDLLAPENAFKGVLDGRRAGAGRAGHHDDGVLHGHGLLQKMSVFGAGHGGMNCSKSTPAVFRSGRCTHSAISVPSLQALKRGCAARCATARTGRGWRPR